MKEVNMTIGRFQPFTKGHLQMLIDGQKKNGLPAVILMIQNKKPDSRHPFSDELVKKELDIVKKNYPYLIEDIFLVSNADIVKNGKLLQEHGYRAELWLCGDDREAPYKKMAENQKYRTEGGYPESFTTYTGTGRVEGVSGTAAREALKAGDQKAFDSLVPKGASKLFKEFQDEISSVKESGVPALSEWLMSEAISSGKRITASTSKKPKLTVSSKDELIREITNCIAEDGPECSLNHIDVSELKDLSDVFSGWSTNMFNGDISEWDPCECENMQRMFYSSKYTGENGDISDWDVRKVRFAGRMFYASKYDGDISRWDFRDLDIKNSPQLIASAPIAKTRKHWPKRFR